MGGDAQAIEIPSDVLNRYKTFKFWQFYWHCVHYSAGVIAILAGCLATASGADAGPPFIQTYTWVWGLLATVLSGVVTLLGPLQRAETYKHAYFKLSSAITRYKVGIIQVDTLMNEYDKAGNVVLYGDPTAKPSDVKA